MDGRAVCKNCYAHRTPKMRERVVDGIRIDMVAKVQVVQFRSLCLVHSSEPGLDNDK